MNDVERFYLCIIFIIYLFNVLRVWNVSKIKFNETVSFKTTDDHSKWGVSDSNSNWICVGDINRAVSIFFRTISHTKYFNCILFIYYRKCKQNVAVEVFVIVQKRFHPVIDHSLPISNHVQPVKMASFCRWIKSWFRPLFIWSGRRC